MLAQALVEFDGGQASLAFDGTASFGPQDRTYIAGTKGSLGSIGRDLSLQSVAPATAAGTETPAFSGTWFNDGVAATMGELLSAIENNREPLNGASANLHGLALTFAAIASTHRGTSVVPGAVRSLTAAKRR